MKTNLLVLLAVMFFSLTASAQRKKNGTPDMRYKANKEQYGTSYTKSSSSYSQPVNYNNKNNYSNGGTYKVQNGYRKSNGTYVSPHIKTSPDNKKYNNKNYYR
ncbi:hypothetical protein [Myroides phaeus]|uniref:hypothetical protein n=1 Tax=Myroides phaeus TaxID=702745 RepID=UPI001303CB35|nr:hypothetical protein [Myroides phaeus]